MKPVLLTSTLLGLILASCTHQYTDSSQDRYTPQVSTPSTTSQNSNKTTYSSSTDVSDSPANHHYDTSVTESVESFSEPSYTQSRHAYSEPAYCPPPARHHHSSHSRRHHNTHRQNTPTRKQKELIREQLRNAYKH